MNVTNITAFDYDNITNDYDKIKITKYTDNGKNIDTIIPTVLSTISCGSSFSCLMSVMVYTLIKPLFNKKCSRNFYSQLIHLAVS